MKITFLGTGTSQGIPIIGSLHPVGLSDNPKDKRLRSSLMLSWADTNIVIDCGPDFRQQMLRHHVNHLEAILFTHEHADHTAGIDDIRPFVHQQGDMPIYALPRVIVELRKRFEYIFATENRYPGAPSVQINEVEEQPFSVRGKICIPIKIWHGTLPILGYRFENVAYITDAKKIDSHELIKLKGIDILIVNCLRKEPHPSHFNLVEVIEITKKIKPKNTYLTHISQNFGFHQTIESELPENIFLAYDGLEIEIT